MKLLKHHQVKQQELKLLETCGHSLAEYGNVTQETQKNSNPENNTVLKSICQVQIKWMKSAGKDANSNLRAFIFVLLHKIYAVKAQEDHLIFLKSTFYSSGMDLCLVKGHELSKLSNNQMKKLVVEFFYLLGYSFFDNKIESKISKYPVIMNIFCIFLRKVLFDHGFKEALDYRAELSTQKTYTALSQFFKIVMVAKDNIFKFPETSMIVVQLENSEHYFGSYAIEKQKDKVIQDQKIQIRVARPAYSSSYSQAPNSPAIVPIRHFLTNNSIKIEKQIISNASIKTNQSFKEFKEAIMKKTKSLKDYPKRKYSNLEQPESYNAHQINETLKQCSSNCKCSIKKKSKMLLSPNIYEFNIRFVPKINEPIAPENQGSFYVSSKGIACQMYEARKSGNTFMKKFFETRKQQQQNNCKQNDPNSSSSNQLDPKTIKSNPHIQQPTSKPLQISPNFNRPKSKFIQQKMKTMTEPSQFPKAQERHSETAPNNRTSNFNHFFTKKTK